MALHLEYSNYAGQECEFIAHVGAGNIRDTFEFVFIHRVQADGHELEKIKEQFPNIRMATNRVVSWTGEDAMFIIKHLKL
jgi:hypothetical protein